MRHALLVSSFVLFAVLPAGGVAAQTPPASAQGSTQLPGPTTASLGGVGPGATAPAPVAAPMVVTAPGVGMGLQAQEQDDEFSHQESALQKQVELLKLQAQVADLQKKIADAQHPSQGAIVSPLIAEPPRAMDAQASTDASSPSSTTVARVSVPEVTKRAPAATAEPTLQLLGVLKIGRAAQATIADRGMAVRVTAGAVLPSGWKVESIEDTSVYLRRGRAHRRLTIGD